MTVEEVKKFLNEHLGEIPMQDEKFDLEEISLLGLFDFIYALETEANIVIPVEDIKTDNFESLEKIYSLICRVNDGNMGTGQVVL